MRTSTRWTLGGLAVVTALVLGLAGQLTEEPEPGKEPEPRRSTAESRTHRDADTPEALAEPRRRADLPPCPAARGGEGLAKLADVVVECAADGSAVEVGRALAGRTVVLNLWAYWCAPCVDELPAMQRYQLQAGDAVTVVTVHQDENEAAALLRMAELGVRLPVLQDGKRSIAAALALPNVMPATVVLRPDGSVAKVLPRSFASAEAIDAEVDSALK
jgi:thiol-disulfide isomerase/thioredoxin